MEPAQQQLAEAGRRGRVARQADALPPKPCPRCDSTNTKFCYYNNYSSSQPRYLCRACRRYWTHGGTLRNVPQGGGGGRRGRRSRRSTAGAVVDDINNHPEVVEHSITATAVVDALPPLPYCSYYSSGVIMDGAAAGSGIMGDFQAATPVAVMPPLFEPHQFVYQFNFPSVQFLSSAAATPHQGWQQPAPPPQQQTVFATTSAGPSTAPNTSAAAGEEAVHGGADGYWRENLISGDGSANWAATAAADLSYRGPRAPFI